MGILEALEIEKITPTQNGIYVCIDAEKKLFKIVKPEELLLTLETGESLELRGILENINNEIRELREKHNSLINILIKNEEVK